ncbi:MAG TPA: nuclear transport factor 2 family protein [Bacillales bacterium]|nr:nuclear transport factor 2 family protein [Bacillales bacterium]
MKTLQEQLYELENRHLQPAVRKSADALGELLADDYIEYGKSGRIFTKKQILESLADSPSPRLVLKDFEVKSLAPGVALTRYRIESPIKHSLRSMVWKKIDGKWQMVFHQGTPTTRDESER